MDASIPRRVRSCVAPHHHSERVAQAELEREARAFAERHAGADALGAFGHPSAAAGCGYHATSAAAASHAVAALTWRGHALEGVVEALPTAAGAALVRALVAGELVGVSTRGWGQMQAAASSLGAAVLVADFQLVTFDVVAQPATSGAPLAPLAVRDSQLCARAAGVLLRDVEGA